MSRQQQFEQNKLAKKTPFSGSKSLEPNYDELDMLAELSLRERSNWDDRTRRNSGSDKLVSLSRTISLPVAHVNSRVTSGRRRDRDDSDSRDTSQFDDMIDDDLVSESSRDGVSN